MNSKKPGIILVSERFWYDFSETSVPYIFELQQVLYVPILLQGYISLLYLHKKLYPGERLWHREWQSECIRAIMIATRSKF